MSLKSRLLAQLEAHREESLSGEALAASFQVSRAAVWKAVGELKREGHRILAVPNKGYRLAPDTDLLSAEGIRPHLHSAYADSEIVALKTVDSTNRYAKRLMADGAAQRTVVVAEEQTAGVGRFGRSFFSPRSEGLYMSAVLRPQLSAADATLLTVAAGVAVCRAIRILTGQQAAIKWVNDVLLGGRKVCGILTEATTDFESGYVSGVVVGIGVNTHTTDEQFAANGLRDIASSLTGGGAQRISRNRLAAEILNTFFVLAENLKDPGLIEEYKSLSYVLGRDVRYTRDGQSTRARALDIGADGTLIVADAAGIRHTLSSGEVSVLPIG